MGVLATVSDWLWSGQSFRAWWSGQPEFFEQHPFAHVTGGVLLDIIWGAVLAVAATGFGLVARHPDLVPVLRLALVGVTQAFWELNQVEQWGRRTDQTPNYPYAFAALDVAASLVGVGLAELVRLAL